MDGLLLNGFTLSCHNKETILITILSYYGNLNPLTRARWKDEVVEISPELGTLVLFPPDMETWPSP